MSSMPDVAALRRLVPDVAQREVFVCGPPDWMNSVQRSLWAADVAPEHIHTEEFAW